MTDPLERQRRLRSREQRRVLRVFDTVINEYLIARAGSTSTGAGDRRLRRVALRVPRAFAFPDARGGPAASANLGPSSVRYEIGIFARGEDHAAAEGRSCTSSSIATSRRPDGDTGRCPALCSSDLW